MVVKKDSMETNETTAERSSEQQQTLGTLVLPFFKPVLLLMRTEENPHSVSVHHYQVFFIKCFQIRKFRILNTLKILLN